MAPEKLPGRRRLGTFIGVFTPTILTILGVIMYLRLGWVVSSVGLLGALLIVVLANAITMLTTLSFSAVATNKRVGVGGAYYIVSRSLGLEIGGAIGVPFFLSQVFSVTLYAYGLAESIAALAWPGAPVAWLAAGIIVVVAALAFRGAKIALLVQVPLMVAIGISILALGYGAFFRPIVEASGAPPPAVAAEAPGFWVVFAVFFPAVTGIMAGLGLSGDLKEPAKALPRGSIAAVLAGCGVYLIVPCLLAMGAASDVLRDDPLVWTRIAPLGALLVIPGLWGAIFSSAVGSLLGAPRTAQAMAMDHIAPPGLAELAGKRREPVTGLVVTTVLALGAVLLGDLNTVALVVSMFFLTVYGTMNLVAALETLSGDPSWRPKIPMPWPLSLLGALACFGVMLLISPVAALAAVTVELILYLVFARRELRADWGDARRGSYESLIRWSLLKLSERPMTARSWRPHILVFAGDIGKRMDLVRFASWFNQARGILTVCELVVGEIMEQGPTSPERRQRLAAALDAEGIRAFPEVDVVQNLVTGIVAVSQANGIAGLESNTIVVGWPKEAERLADLLRVVRQLDRIHKSAIIGRIEERWLEEEDDIPLIHIWWGGLQRNGDLMLLLAWLLTLNPEWRRARLRLMSVVLDEASRAERLKAITELLAEARITAEPRITILPTGMKVGEVIRRESAPADVVFLGLNIPEPGTALSYSRQLKELSEGLRTVFFVRNSSLFRGELV